MVMVKVTWDPKLAKIYRKLPPPGPPSISELKVYERFVRPLKNKKNVKALILGSTPGLRDLCLKYKIFHTCVDYHPENFKIASTAMKYKDKQGLSSLIVSDWSSMKLPEKYDLILGDISFGMVPFYTLDKILIKVARALKPKGQIVHRTWMRKKGHFKNFEEYLRKIHPLRRKQVSPFTSLTIPFVHYFYETKRERVKFSQNIKKLKVFVDKGLLLKEDYDLFHFYYSRYMMPNYYPLRAKYERKLKKYLKIKKVLCGKDWFKDYALIYVFGKK